MPTVRTLRLVNPRKRSRSRNRKRNNVLYVLTNPKRKTAMAKHRRTKKNRSHFGVSKRKHRNPFLKRRGHRRNPMFGGVSAKQILELGLGAAGGVIGAGYLSQLVLGGSNVGVMGYVADSVSTLALAWLANKFSSGDIAKGVLAGGFGAVIKRIWVENVSGASGSMSGLGNMEFAGLGAYKSGSFPLPTTSGNYALQSAPGAAAGSGAAIPSSTAVQAPTAISRYSRW